MKLYRQEMSCSTMKSLHVTLRTPGCPGVTVRSETNAAAVDPQWTPGETIDRSMMTFILPAVISDLTKRDLKLTGEDGVLAS